VNSYSKTLARYIEQENTDLVTTAWNEDLRAGKVFIDYSMNARGKTLCTPYSPRPMPLATVSAPVRWDELESTSPTDFTIFTIRARVEQVGDLWRHILEHAQHLKRM
jgi:DNA primase